jgi:hypothetical protein
MEGKDAMNRNGRKWTIGYKTEIDLGKRKVNFIFDTITDEGGGSSKYIVYQGSDQIFNDMTYKIVGVKEFTKKLVEILAKEKY